MPASSIILLLLLMVAVVATIVTRKLTITAGIMGGIVAIVLYKAAGLAGVTFMAVFFLLGTMATSHQAARKRKLGLAESNKGRRTANQVFANAGVAAIAGVVGILFPAASAMMLLLIAASFSSATADTLSSELGNVYGKKYFNILTLRKDRRGLDGVVSIEGTLWGMAGSLIIALAYCIFTNTFFHFWIIITAGTIGNIADSVIGSALERKDRIKNNAVNFLNTLTAAFVAWLIYVLH